MPERPEAMDHDDLDGAEAAGIFFVELFYYAMATGDLELWDAMSGETCGFCTATRDNVADVYDNRGRFETSPPLVEEVSSHISTDERGEYLVEIHTTAQPVRELDASDSLVSEAAGTQVLTHVLLSSSGTEWIVDVLQSQERTDG